MNILNHDQKFLIDLKTEDLNKPIKKYIRAVIYNPQNKKFLFGYFGNIKGENKYGLIGGSIDDGEDEIAALNREVKEETGLTDYTIVCKLGKSVLSPRDPEFDKDELIKQNDAYLVIVNSFQTDNTNYTQNEIKNGFKTLWDSGENIKFVGFYKQYQIFLDEAKSFLKDHSIDHGISHNINRNVS